MKSANHGKNISRAEVTNISSHGVWIIVDDRELFMPFDRFPWFKNAPIGKILHVEMHSDTHVHWPELDVDLDIDRILNPENYPLVDGRHERVKDDG